MHTTMRHKESGIPSEYEKDFLPSVWQSIQCSCIPPYRAALLFYMIVGCEVVKNWQGKKTGGS